MAFKIPGVPALLNKAVQAFVPTLLGNAAASLWNYLFPAAQWGIFKPGGATPAVIVSSVVAVGARKESAVSDFRLESGSFTTYNKVETPRAVPIRITREGNAAERAELLAWAEEAVVATTLFDIATPETAYANMTLQSYSIERSAQSGAGLIVLDCLFQQVRQQPALYTGGNVAGPENKPTVPTQRVNTIASGAGSGVQWR